MDIIGFVVLRLMYFAVAFIPTFIIIFSILKTIFEDTFEFGTRTTSIIGGSVTGLALVIYQLLGEIAVWSWVGMFHSFINIALWILLGGSIYVLIRYIRMYKKIWIKRGATPIVLLAIVILSGGLTLYWVGYYRGMAVPVQNARYFDGLVEKVPAGEILFENEVSSSHIRLVDSRLATAIASRHLSEFGSNIGIRSIHITTYEQELVWIASLASDNFFQDRITGYMIISATDPSMTPIFSTDQDPDFVARVSENLFYGTESSRHSYLHHSPWLSYGRSYLTWNDVGEPRQVQLYNKIGAVSLVRELGGALIYDMNGKLLQDAPFNQLPAWVTQTFDEDWVETHINNWGSYRTQTGFDYFAGGFFGLITPSPFRVEISRDTRYIQDVDNLDEFIGIVPVHPVNNDQTMAGFFKISRETIKYFDFSGQNIVSARTAEKYVEGRFYQPASGYIYAVLPLLYPIQYTAGNQTASRLAWYIPVYWTDEYGENTRLDSIYIVDSQNLEILGSATLEGHSNAAQMVDTAKQNYLQVLTGAEPKSNETVIVEVEGINSYVEDGTTNIIFSTNNSQIPYMLASPTYLEIEDWIIAMNIIIGDEIEVEGYVSNDIYILTSITVL